jgi:hypothetical protein
MYDTANAGSQVHEESAQSSTSKKNTWCAPKSEPGREKISCDRGAHPLLRHSFHSPRGPPRALARSRAPPRRAHHLLDESPLLSSIAMPPPHAALLVLPAATAAPLCPRPPLGPSHRAHPTVVRVRAAALRALPWRVGLWPPPSSALPTPKEQSAGSGEAPACCLVGLLVLGALRSVGLTPVMAVGDRLGCRSWTG